MQLVFSFIFSKGFDTVDHDILLNNLNRYGIRVFLFRGLGVTWAVEHTM